ncbi:MAG: two-component system response regulator [Fibrobacteres bacterium]|nr:two-component system response regulator [Fibrobacterota bacterium]
MAKRILVVDDNLINLKLASEMMECEGYLVDRASNAETALAAIALNLPNLVLMDLALPGMDGLALTRHLRSQESTRHIPVVALTAFAMKRDEERALEAGCDAYIVKPIDTRKLPALLAEILKGR